MSDDAARAVGAGSITIEIAGKQCTVRPLGIRELTEVERDCLGRYKRQYLESVVANLDLLPVATRDRLMEQKYEAANRWDINDLPTKYAHDPKRVKITTSLKTWLQENLSVAVDADDLQIQRMAAVALDQELLGDEEYRKLSDGNAPPKLKVPYVNWWITGCFDGMITFVWVCFKHNGITRDQVVEELGSNMNLLVEVSREIERLSVPAVGNG